MYEKCFYWNCQLGFGLVNSDYPDLYWIDQWYGSNIRSNTTNLTLLNTANNTVFSLHNSKPIKFDHESNETTGTVDCTMCNEPHNHKQTVADVLVIREDDF